MAILVDTGPLYALADADDQYHEAVVSYVSATSEALIVPSPVVPEVCYLLLEYLGAEAETQFLRSLSGQELLLEHFTTADLGRAIQILEQYRDAEFGMVDATLMAMAERLKIMTVLTIDRRASASTARGTVPPCASSRICPQRARSDEIVVLERLQDQRRGASFQAPGGLTRPRR